MDETTVKIALKFLHKYIGFVMYFPDNVILKDIVICDPQVVFSSVSELIFNIYDPAKRTIAPSRCQRFVRSGRFSPEDIETDRKDLMPIEKLIELLVHLNIAVRIPGTVPPEYFFPAVLNSAKVMFLVKVKAEGQESQKQLLEPLCIRFCTGFLPLGLMCNLIANLFSNEDFDIEFDKEEVIYRNKISFLFQGQYNVQLISWPKYCEARVSRASGTNITGEFHSDSCCPLIKDTLVKTLNTVVDKMRQSSLFQFSQGYDLAFKCPNHSQEAHAPGHEPLAVIEQRTQNQGPQTIKCIVCKRRLNISTQMSPWFGKVSCVHYFVHSLAIFVCMT